MSKFSLRFNLEDYTGRAVMHCKTVGEADIFCRYLHSHGRRWSDKSSYLTNSMWYAYQEDTCYNFNDGTYGAVDACRAMDFIILEFEDFDWSSVR